MNEFIAYMESGKVDSEMFGAMIEKGEYKFDGNMRCGDCNMYHNICICDEEKHYHWSNGHLACGCYSYCDCYESQEQRGRAWRRKQRMNKIEARSKVIANWGNRPTPQMLEWIDSSMQGRGFNFKLDDYPTIKDIQNVRKALGLTDREFGQILRAISNSVRQENFNRNMERYSKGEIKLTNHKRVERESTNKYSLRHLDKNGEEYFTIHQCGNSVEWITEEEKDAEKIVNRLKKMSRDYGAKWFIRYAEGIVTGRLAKHQYKMGRKDDERDYSLTKQGSKMKVNRREIEEEVTEFFLEREGFYDFFDMEEDESYEYYREWVSPFDPYFDLMEGLVDNDDDYPLECEFCGYLFCGCHSYAHDDDLDVGYEPLDYGA